MAAAPPKRRIRAARKPTKKAAKPAAKRARAPVRSLRWAAQFGYLDEVERFLARGAHPDGDGDESTPLEMACFHRKVPVVRALLAAGASPRKGGPLRYAVTSGSKRTAELVRMLLDAGADPNEPGYRDGETVADLCGRGLEDVRAMLLAARQP